MTLEKGLCIAELTNDHSRLFKSDETVTVLSWASFQDARIFRAMLRRTWIQGWLIGTVRTVAGLSWSQWMLTEVKAVQSGPGTLYVLPADYPALQSPGGSVLIDFITIDGPLLINRASSFEFHAMSPVCTHAGCLVGEYAASAGYIRCSCHGSRYDIAGRVIQGPAEADLPSFVTHFDKDTGELKIEIPSLPMDAKPIGLYQKKNDQVRLKLTFEATAQGKYEVQFQPDLSGAFQSMPFAVTPNGLATQTQMTASSEGLRHVYVDATTRRGFYVVVRVD